MFQNLEDLMPSARIAMREVLDVKEGEKVLIVTNPEDEVMRISHALYNAALWMKARPVLVFQEVKTQLDLAEPSVIGALRSEPDVMISISREKLGKDGMALKSPYLGEQRTYDHIFNYLLGEKRSRAFWSPGVSEEMFKKTVAIDYAELRRRCAVICERMTRADVIHVTTDRGTDILIGIKGRQGRADDGDFRQPGKGGNLPAGEVFISPALGTSSGTIVFDGSIACPTGEVLIVEPIVVLVEDGFVTEVRGGKEADALRQALKDGEETALSFGRKGKLKPRDAEAYARNAYNLGEFGIGLNPKAEIVGNMLEDEKVFRTCHIAIGANYDEDAKALIHLDGLIWHPTITLQYPDGREELIMDGGELLI